jgi:PAS domain S-box-containing protein
MNTSFNDTQNLPFSDSSPEAIQSSECLERRLEISEARIRSLLARLPQIVWLAQVNGEITEFNQRWYEYTGLTAVESLGWEFLKAVHPEDRDRFLSRYNSALKQSPSYDNLECRLLRADGTYRWFLTQATPVLGGDNQLLEWVGTFTLKEEYQSLNEEEQGKPGENVLPPVGGKLLTMDLSKDFASLAYEPTAHQEFSSITTQLAVGERHPANFWMRKPSAAKTAELAKNRFRNLVKDLSHTIIWEADATAEQYTFVSSSAEQVLGYPVEQWLSEPDFWVKLIHPEDRQWTVALCRKEMYQSRDYELEYRCLAADNRVVWLRDRAYIVRDDQGQVHKRRGLMVDITLAKQAETELLTRCRQQAIVVQLGQKALLGAKISALLEEGVSLVSQALAVEYCKVMELLPDGNILRLRTGVGWRERLVGQVEIEASPDTHAGYTLHCRQPVIVEDLRCETRFRGSSLLHDHDVVSGMSVVIEVKSYPESLESTSANSAYRPFGVLGAYTSRQRTFKGSDLHFLQSVAHVLGAAIEHQQADEALYEVRDKLAQTTTILNQTRGELEKRTRELEQFAYVASHDLKAPIRAIANLSQWIEDDISDQLDEENLYQMQLLRGRVYRLEALMEGLLQYSRVGRLKANPERVDVEALLRQVIDILEPPPQFTVEIALQMPTLFTERLLLQEVFTHLIGNAIKHHPSPAGTVTIDVRELADAYEFAVTDDGEGIAPQFQERVFVIFQTLQARDEVENTGIGLAIVKKIVESRGGIIQVESQEGRGARFSFTWPI